MKILGVPGTQALIENMKKLIAPNAIIVTDTKGILDAEGIINTGEYDNVQVNMTYEDWYKYRKYINSICIANADGTNHHHYSLNFILDKGVLNGFNCNYYESSEIKENVILRWNADTRTWKVQARTTILNQNPKFVVLSNSNMDIDPFHRYYLCVTGDRYLNIKRPTYPVHETEIIIYNNSGTASTIYFSGQLSYTYPNKSSFEIPANSERVFHIHRYENSQVLFVGPTGGNSSVDWSQITNKPTIPVIKEVASVPPSPAANTLYCIPE